MVENDKHKLSTEVEFKGHLIDSMILTRALATIMDMDGDFDIIEFKVGRRKADTSHAILRVYASTKEQMDGLLSTLRDLGGTIPDVEDVHLEPAPKDMVAPRGFYSTTNHPTYIKFNGDWIEVENVSMDRLVVVREGKPLCIALSELKEGDPVVVGSRGIRVMLPERPRKRSIFGFMGGPVSSERPTTVMIDQIAKEIVELNRVGGKIAVVAGPAIVHTGADEAFSYLVREGYVNVLLAGNALAVHDVEYNRYGTSLGMNIKEAKPVDYGHRHHLYAINDIIECGSLKKAVEMGVLTSGIMYECIVNDVPFVLAGSIRDDGPLPDVIRDSVVAKKKMEELLRGCDMVIMVATMLHSIAVGNLLSSSVKTICVDVNPAAVTKLMDRGSAQAMGLITDVGVFFPMLVESIKKITGVGGIASV
ncbi:MAG: ornithine cyclodeaminase, nickel-pincer nucleotide-dependent [Methermicoccaceae archaeon]